ncbi:hypothetical protein PR048_021655 [Dryococelus australis]|uniref:CCHC-type domain-containing protein n=1 Tax=Dryococelus australis TaxID=614101 RepID=A0ABQ9GYU3_9NEOP|nr:hypothetical protein PR048_021655 [Dryococelus australis]
MATLSDNFAQKFQIVVLMKAADICSVITDEDDATKREKDWEKKNAKAQSYIVMIDRGNVQFIMSCNTAKKMLEKLRSVYERDSIHNKNSLHLIFFNLKIDCVASGLSELQNLSVKLKGVGHVSDDETMIGKILSSLPSSFKFFFTAWDSTAKCDQTLTKNLIARLLGEDECSCSSSEGDNVAFKMVIKDIVCYRCNNRGHISRNCVFKSKACKICKKDNHSEENCFFRNKDNRAVSRENFKVAFLTESSSKDQEVTWFLDSGCTSHMANTNQSLLNVSNYDSKIMISKIDENLYAKHKGDIEYKECVRKDVLYVPGLTKNLLSINKITESGGSVKFAEDKMEISKGCTKIEGSKDATGLYSIRLICCEKTFLSESKQYKKLQNLSFENMKKLTDLYFGLGNLKFGVETVCETCLSSKQTRKTFGGELDKAIRP